VPFLAAATTATGDVEGNRDQVADLQKFDIPATLNNLSRYLVAQHQSSRRGRPPSHHVLIASANVGGHDLENDAVVAFSVAQFQYRKVNALDLHDARLHINNPTISCHDFLLPFRWFPFLAQYFRFNALLFR
jgi:hypothetical protein